MYSEGRLRESRCSLLVIFVILWIAENRPHPLSLRRCCLIKLTTCYVMIHKGRLFLCEVKLKPACNHNTRKRNIDNTAANELNVAERELTGETKSELNEIQTSRMLIQTLRSDGRAENICPTSHRVPVRPSRSVSGLKYYIRCHVAWRWTGTLCRYSNTRFMSQFCCCHTVSLINHKTDWSLNYPNSLVSGGKSSSAALIHSDRKSMLEKLSLTLKHTAAH